MALNSPRIIYGEVVSKGKHFGNLKNTFGIIYGEVGESGKAGENAVN